LREGQKQRGGEKGEWKKEEGREADDLLKAEEVRTLQIPLH
jgi:hypothetical protein